MSKSVPNTTDSPRLPPIQAWRAPEPPHKHRVFLKPLKTLRMPILATRRLQLRHTMNLAREGPSVASFWPKKCEWSWSKNLAWGCWSSATTLYRWVHPSELTFGAVEGKSAWKSRYYTLVVVRKKDLPPRHFSLAWNSHTEKDLARESRQLCDLDRFYYS